MTPLRSSRWFDADDLRGFGHRSRLMHMGYSRDNWEGGPVIAIVNTWSDINPCHSHFRARAKDVKRGVLQAEGFPIEFPALSLSENFVKPTTMLYRNLLESARTQIRSGLRKDLRRSHFAGRTGLRLWLPGNRFRRSGAGTRDIVSEVR